MTKNGLKNKRKFEMFIFHSLNQHNGIKCNKYAHTLLVGFKSHFTSYNMRAIYYKLICLNFI